MAENVLGTLFGDIAAAIRERNAEAGTMKPVQFPEKIRGIDGKSPELKWVTFVSYDGLTEYGKKAVAVGDDCADPIARGIFDTPKRESTAQYNYTFYGWANTPNGGADANWYKSITEDKIVYANFAAAVRYYTITYYDGDTVLKTESLPYGATPTYVAEKDGYNFEGWEPALATVTGDASYYSQWSSAITFAGASWEDIAEISAAGTAASTFKVGDEKNVQITYADGTTATMTVRIAGFNHDDLADGSGKAGISVLCKTVPNYTTLWSESERFYNNSLVAEALAENGDIWNMLPSELTSVIKPVSKKYDKSKDTGSTPSLGTVNASLWALSVDEMGLTGNAISNSPGSTQVSALGSKYALFSTLSGSSGITTPFLYFEPIVAGDTTVVWLRTLQRPGTLRPFYAQAYTNTITGKPVITYSSGSDNYYKTYERKIWFGFCI